jgi:phosphatidate phosphatase APP1
VEELMARARWGVALLLLLFACKKSEQPGRLILFDGFGTPQRAQVRGRLLVDPGLAPSSTTAAGADNLLASWRTLETDEIPGATIEVRIAGRTEQLKTDHDGCFALTMESGETPFPLGALQLGARVVEDHGHPTPPAESVAYIVADEPAVAVISDLDDTVIETGVKDKARLLDNTLLKNGLQVPLVPGVVEAYRAAEEAGATAFFYVSGSPHSFHDRLSLILRHHQLPRGPLFLKNLGEDSLLAHDEYKLGKIRAILDALPRLNFVLVGDTGERDPEIYATIREERPDRVVGTVLRRAPGSTHRAERFEGALGVDDYAQDPALIARLVKGSTVAVASP